MKPEFSGGVTSQGEVSGQRSLAVIRHRVFKYVDLENKDQKSFLKQKQ